VFKNGEIMDKLIEFFRLGDPNIRYVVFGSVILAVSSAVVGTFTFLKKRALTGDAVAHSVLPGVCLAFILSGTKNPFALIIGAFITGWLSLLLIEWVTKKSKIKEDTAIGLTLSVFFGIGILLLTSIQRSGNAAQSGLDHFLFGKAASLVGEDLIVFSITGIILIVTVIAFYKELKVISFDPNFSTTSGIPVKALDLLLTSLTVLAVVVGIQAVGVVLMAAMLITPAAASKYWTDKLLSMVLLSALFGAISGISGAFISYVAPSMPTGPWIVVIISMIAIFSFFFAPKKGIISKEIQQRKNKDKIMEDNILKLFYHLSENKSDFFTSRSLKEMIDKRKMDQGQLKRGLHRLINDGSLIKDGENWKLTEKGKSKGQRVVKLHRLWEVYLTNQLQIAPDHVHEDAETIEHIITPEIEAELEKLLKYPEVDPHRIKIPY
jgi:manganese/zinc/iron transport system permease protein